MAGSPSPYAPGIIGDERAPPRPAGRPVVFLVATFVLTLVASGTLFFDWAANLELRSDNATDIGVLGGAATVPRFLMLLWAYLSDRVPLWGTRREGYLLFAALIAALTWVALALGGDRHAVWIVGAVLLAGASTIMRAVVTGGLAEIGQRTGAPGRLAAAYFCVAEVAVIATSVLAGSLSRGSIWLTAGVAAGLALALVVLFIVVSDDVAPVATPPAPARPSIWRFLGSRRFWSSAAVCALAGAATVPRELFDRMEIETLGIPWMLQSMIPPTVIVFAILYFLFARRIPFATLLRVTLAIKALALLVHPLSMDAPGHFGAPVAFLFRAGANGLLSIALLDLALRAAPPGREAFGAMALATVTSIVVFVSNGIEEALGFPVERVAWFAAAAALTAGIPVSLLPQEIAGRRDAAAGSDSKLG